MNFQTILLLNPPYIDALNRICSSSYISDTTKKMILFLSHGQENMV